MLVSEGRGQRVLIVEDEAVVAMDLEQQLEQFGYRVVGIVDDAEEACRQAHELQPDVILMDVRLKGKVDGITAAERIRSRKAIPIVFITAYIDELTISRAKTVEPYGYIVKPFDGREIHTTLQVALYKQNLDTELRKNRTNLLAILDAQRQGTILIDPEGRIAFASSAAHALFGTDDATLVGNPWRQALPIGRETREEITTAMSRTAGIREKVVAQIDRDTGGVKTVEVEVCPDPRTVGGAILFFYDISQLYELRQLLDKSAEFESIVGKSQPIKRVTQFIHDLSTVDSSVLIEGETGTGKELAARAIHNLSRRSGKTFVAVNCAGLSEELAASQLFGHRKGAFTGAVHDQPGMFEAAHGGTLFLDEIGELPVRVQTTLLRVLETHSILRLGEAAERDVDTRIIVATNRDLAGEVEAGRFRADLFYRIRVARITLPPLRQRREDIPLLARKFLSDHVVSLGKTVQRISDDAMATLLEYPWPGNVRELKNALEFALIHARKPLLEVADLPPEIISPDASRLALLRPVDSKDALLEVLRESGGNRSEAAKALGISRATLYRRLAQYGIAED